MAKNIADLFGEKKQDKSKSTILCKFIMPFVTSYLCEQGFSSILYLKNK
jgi:hypothetical protein